MYSWIRRATRAAVVAALLLSTVVVTPARAAVSEFSGIATGRLTYSTPDSPKTSVLACRHGSYVFNDLLITNHTVENGKHGVAAMEITAQGSTGTSPILGINPTCANGPDGESGGLPNDPTASGNTVMDSGSVDLTSCRPILGLVAVGNYATDCTGVDGSYIRLCDHILITLAGPAVFLDGSTSNLTVFVKGKIMPDPTNPTPYWDYLFYGSYEGAGT